MIFFYLTKKCSQLHVSSLQNFPPKAPINQLCISSIVFECRNSNFSKQCKKIFQDSLVEMTALLLLPKLAEILSQNRARSSQTLLLSFSWQTLSSPLLQNNHNQQSVKSDWRLFLIDRRSPLKSLSVLYHADHRQGLVGHLVIPPGSNLWPSHLRAQSTFSTLAPPSYWWHHQTTLAPPWYYYTMAPPFLLIKSDLLWDQSVGWLTVLCELVIASKILKRLYLRAFTTLAPPLLTTGDNILPLCYYQKTNMRPKRDTGWLI